MRFLVTLLTQAPGRLQTSLQDRSGQHIMLSIPHREVNYDTPVLLKEATYDNPSFCHNGCSQDVKGRLTSPRWLFQPGWAFIHIIIYLPIKFLSLIHAVSLGEGGQAEQLSCLVPPPTAVFPAALKAPSVHTLHPEAWIAACSLGFCGWRGSRAHNFLLPAPQQQPPPRALQEMAAALPAPPPHRSRCQRAPGPPPRGRGGRADCKELIGQGWSQAYGLHADFQFNKESVPRSLKLEPYKLICSLDNNICWAKPRINVIVFVSKNPWRVTAPMTSLECQRSHLLKGLPVSARLDGFCTCFAVQYLTLFSSI